MLQFTFDPQNTTLCCIFDGRMDSVASMEAEKVLTTKLASATKEIPADKLKVVFDLGSVNYIASAFMRVCIQTAKIVSREKFAVRRTSPFVMKIFVMAGLDKELNVS